MDIDFESEPGTLIISMIKYLSQMIEEWPEELKGHKVNPQVDHLFTINNDDDRELLCTRGYGSPVSSHYSPAVIYVFKDSPGRSDCGLILHDKSERT